MALMRDKEREERVCDMAWWIRGLVLFQSTRVGSQRRPEHLTNVYNSSTRGFSAFIQTSQAFFTGVYVCMYVRIYVHTYIRIYIHRHTERHIQTKYLIQKEDFSI